MIPRRDGYCAICGSGTRGTDPHHVVYRSAQGPDTAENILFCCRRCHDAIHRGGWTIAEYSPSRLLVMQGEEVVIDIPYPPPEWDQGNYISMLDLVEGFFERATEEVKWLDNEGLVAATEATRNIGSGIWIYQAELIYWAMRRIPRGSRVERLNAIAEAMSMKQSYAYALLRIRESFPTVVSDERKLPPGFYRVAATQPDPPAALAMAEERVAEDPRYTVRQFAKEVQGEAVCGWRHGDKCDFRESQRCSSCPERKT